MASKSNDGVGLGTLLAVVTGLVLVAIPEPATTATGLAIIAGTFGFRAVSN